MAAPPSPPASPCSGSCNGNVDCGSLMALSCLELSRVTEALGCHDSCQGCCTQGPPAPPSPLLPPPSPPLLPPPPAPHFPSSACPWVNANSNQTNILVCADGSRCNWNTGRKGGCCDCHGGRAMCPPEAPLMCSQLCAPDNDFCCTLDCDYFGGPRACGSPARPPLQACVPSPPAPPVTPPLPPGPPFAPYVIDWMHHYDLVIPAGINCHFDPYTEGVDYRVAWSDTLIGDCANECLRTPGCTGIEAPADESYCLRWFNDACNSSSAPGAYLGPTSGPNVVVEYVRVLMPPPFPPLLPAPPAPPPLPASCMRECGSLRCEALLALSCEQAQAVTRSLGCISECQGCCSVFSPSPPPPSPPSVPPPRPPPPAYPTEACPWMGVSSGEVDVVVCFDGTRCSFAFQGWDCCDCRGGRAVCPSNHPLMCNMEETLGSNPRPTLLPALDPAILGP